MSAAVVTTTGRLRTDVRPSRAQLEDGVFVLVLCALGLVGFRTTYTGWTYLAVGMAGLVLGGVIAHLATALRQSVVPVIAAVIAAFFLLGGVLTLRSAGPSSAFPTLDTLRSLARLGIHSWKDLLTTLPPVDGHGPLLVVPYILGLVCGAAGVTIARRTPRAWPPAVAPLAVLAASILLGTAHSASRVLQGAVFAVVALGWISRRNQRRQVNVGVRSRTSRNAGHHCARASRHGRLWRGPRRSSPSGCRWWGSSRPT